MHLDSQRGVIRNREFAAQIRDFSGLKFGKITPTDIDGFIDFGNKLFVFIESKFGGAKLSYGQQLALERLCDACHSPPSRYSICFVCRHDSNGDIDFSSSVVVRYRWNGKWVDGTRGVNLIDAISSMREKYV